MSAVIRRADTAWVKGLLAVIGVLFLVIVPSTSLSSYWVLVAASVCVFVVYALSYNLLLGQVGLFSLAHAMFFGVGAYFIANIVSDGGSWFLGAVLGVLGTALLALLVGAATLRVPGIYFSIVTVAIAQAVYTAATRNVFGLTGGENGIYLDSLPDWLNVNVEPETVYWVTLGVALVVLVGIWHLRRSPMGQNWEAIRENPIRAEALGLDVRAHRLMAFTMAGALAGLAGVLNAITLQIAAPDQLALTVMVQVLLAVVIGGPGTFLGPVLGAIFVSLSGPLLDQLERASWVEDLPSTLERAITSQNLVLGIIYIILVLFLPGGFATLRLRRRRRERAAPEVGSGEGSTAGSVAK